MLRSECGEGGARGSGMHGSTDAGLDWNGHRVNLATDPE